MGMFGGGGQGGGLFSSLMSMFGGGAQGGGFFSKIGSFFMSFFGAPGARHGGLLKDLFAGHGGIARGSDSGYPTILHGTEAVVPLPNGRSIPVEVKGPSAMFGGILGPMLGGAKTLLGPLLGGAKTLLGPLLGGAKALLGPMLGSAKMLLGPLLGPAKMLLGPLLGLGAPFLGPLLGGALLLGKGRKKFRYGGLSKAPKAMFGGILGPMLGGGGGMLSMLGMGQGGGGLLGMLGLGQGGGLLGMLGLGQGGGKGMMGILPLILMMLLGKRSNMFRYGGLSNPMFGEGGIAKGTAAGYPAILHGTEAVVPLPNGRSIPVEMSGQGSSINNVSVNVSVDNNGNGSVSTNSANELGAVIGQAVQIEIQKQKRHGGLLSPYGAK